MLSNFFPDLKELKIKTRFCNKNIKKYIRKAKLNEKFHFHCLRHTATSWMIQNGIGIYQVSKLFGRAYIKTTKI